MAQVSYSISELSKEFNITLRALRFYEDKKLLFPTREGDKRIYSPYDRECLKAILWGKRVGLTIAEIRQILDSRRYSATESALCMLTASQIDGQISYLERRIAELNDALSELRQMRTMAPPLEPVWKIRDERFFG